MRKIIALALATICTLMMLYGCSKDNGGTNTTTVPQKTESSVNNGTVTDTDGFIGNEESTSNPAMPNETTPNNDNNMGETIMSDARNIVDDVL
ncbi:MAG: hypothetical protein Q4D44_07100 [Eubacteriales bacterium]|nr:hypothetical protein [Eubacteriales bacterium]